MALFFYKEKNKDIRAAAYLRLSIEDGDKAESNSIGNQRELIRDFAAERPGLHLVEEYADDGYTGTNFERPGFKRMMEDIKSGKINCIIVKDLSRLGRNYIEMGKYLEQIFPMMGIRFIAINDNYDNANTESSESDSIVVPFKNLLNDSYCREALIMDQLHLFITQLSDRRKVVEELRKIEDVQNPVYRAKGEIMSLTDKVSQMAKKREQLYADYVAGVVDSEDYQLIREDYSRQYDGLRAALQEAENKKVQVEQQIEEYLNMTSHLEEHLDNFEFDIQLVKSLVQKIEVSADKRIRIVFGFRDVFTELGKESAET